MKNRIYLDMDGVLADFDAVSKQRNIPPKEMKMIQGIYQLLPVFPGARDGVKALLNTPYDIWILTKTPDKNPYAATEKLLWANVHFPELKYKVLISPDKGAVGDTGDVLVDDHPEWANAKNFGGTVIHFDGNWKALIDKFINSESTV